MPARLAELLTARVSDCGPRAWALLAAMSVAGRALTEDQLTGVTGLDAEALRAGLRELASRSLAETTPGGRHRARHALLAEAAAARLLPGERRALHERLAEALGAGGKALAAEAADHWAAAGRDADELRARLTAARAAERVAATPRRRRLAGGRSSWPGRTRAPGRTQGTGRTSTAPDTSGGARM